jgi:hypothetical protein
MRSTSDLTNIWWTDPRRLAIGEAIGIALPASALHLYPAQDIC